MQWQLWINILTIAFLSAGCGAPSPPGWNWNARSGEFRWHAGMVQLPLGTRHEVMQGADTTVGRFLLPNGLIIKYDIGGYAGAWAGPESAETFEAWTARGAQVWMATRPWGPSEAQDLRWLAAVTFVNNGCANFYTHIKAPEQSIAIRDLAASFQPDGSRTGQSSHCIGSELSDGNR